MDVWDDIGLREKSKATLDEIKAYMDRSFAEPLTVSGLAELAGVSPKHFAGLFRRTYGRGVLDHLTDLRINRAKRYLLDEAEWPIREVARKVGYRDEFYFSRKFKREVGMAPSAYARDARGACLRVIACSPAAMGHLLALGVVPAAAPLDAKWTPYYHYVYRARIATHLPLEIDTQAIGDVALARLRPDAIVGTDSLSEERRGSFASIAPALFYPEKGVHWKDQLRAVAALIGKEKEAEERIAAHDAKAKAAALALGRTLGQDRLIVLRIYGDEIYAYCNAGIRDVLFGDLGLNPAFEADEGADSNGLYNEKISESKLSEIDPERIWVLVCPEPASRAYWLGLLHSRRWQALRAAKKGCVQQIPSDPWYEYSATAADRMVDEALLMIGGGS